MSIEFALGVALALALYLLDKSDKSSGLLNLALLFALTAFLLHPTLSISWLWMQGDLAIRVWRIAAATTIILLAVSWFGIWTWPSRKTPAPTTSVTSGASASPTIGRPALPLAASTQPTLDDSAPFDVAAAKAAIQAARIKVTTDAERARVEKLEKQTSALTESSPIVDYAITRFTDELRRWAKENNDDVTSDYRTADFYVLAADNRDAEATIKFVRDPSWTFRVTFQQRYPPYTPPARLVILSIPKLSTVMPEADALRFEIRYLSSSEIRAEVFAYGDRIPPEQCTPTDFKGPIRKLLSIFMAAQLERYPLRNQPTIPTPSSARDNKAPRVGPASEQEDNMLSRVLFGPPETHQQRDAQVQDLVSRSLQAIRQGQIRFPLYALQTEGAGSLETEQQLLEACEALHQHHVQHPPEEVS